MSTTSLCKHIYRSKQNGKKRRLSSLILWLSHFGPSGKNERNSRIFNQKEKSVYEVWKDILALTGLYGQADLYNLSTTYTTSSIALNINTFV